MVQLNDDVIRYIMEFHRENHLPFDKQELLDYLYGQWRDRKHMRDRKHISYKYDYRTSTLSSYDKDHTRFALQDIFISYNYHIEDCTPEEKNHARIFTMIIPPFDEEHPVQYIFDSDPRLLYEFSYQLAMGSEYHT